MNPKSYYGMLGWPFFSSHPVDWCATAYETCKKEDCGQNVTYLQLDISGGLSKKALYVVCKNVTVFIIDLGLLERDIAILRQY